MGAGSWGPSAPEGLGRCRGGVTAIHAGRYPPAARVGLGLHLTLRLKCWKSLELGPRRQLRGLSGHPFLLRSMTVNPKSPRAASRSRGVAGSWPPVAAAHPSRLSASWHQVGHLYPCPQAPVSQRGSAGHSGLCTPTSSFLRGAWASPSLPRRVCSRGRSRTRLAGGRDSGISAR